MNRLRMLILTGICLSSCLGTSIGHAGVFRNRRGACRTCCEPSRCPEGTAPRTCENMVCPQYTTEPAPADPNDSVLWYATKCPTSSVPWHGPYNHGPGNCPMCNNCETATRKKFTAGGVDFFVAKSTSEKGIKKQARKKAKDAFTGVYIRKTKEKYAKLTLTKEIFVQTYEFEMSIDKVHWSPVRFGVEVQQDASTTAIDAMKLKKEDERVAKIRDKDGDEYIILTETPVE